MMHPDQIKADFPAPGPLVRKPPLSNDEGSVPSQRFNRRVATALLWASIFLMIAGCQSGPARAFKGARHYSVGTAALEGGETLRAIQELEAAARWVPGASEIQNHLALAYWADGQRDRAEIAFTRAVELDCENEAAQSNFARFRREAATTKRNASTEASIAPFETSGSDREGEQNDGG